MAFKNLINFFRGKRNVQFEDALAEDLYLKAPNENEQMRAADEMWTAHTLSLKNERGLGKILHPRRDSWMIKEIRNFQEEWNRTHPDNQRDILSDQESENIQSLAEHFDHTDIEFRRSRFTPGEKKG